jgi:hypothetical protein
MAQALLALALTLLAGLRVEAAVEREPVMLSVVAVNPSAEKTQTLPIRIDLPREVKPADVLDVGELTLEYDDDQQNYYVFKDLVALEPKQTLVFEVRVKDVWFVPQPELDSLRDYASLLMSRIKNTEYANTAKALTESIHSRLGEIAATQDDETLSRKARIGAYRHHLDVVAQVKEDLSRMEKLLTFTGGPPVPELLEQSSLKSDAPSKTTTWMVIFLILIFIGLLGGQFFFTWSRRANVTRDLSILREATFGKQPGKAPTGQVGNGHGAAPGTAPRR